jgi:hypothetical protein
MRHHLFVSTALTSFALLGLDNVAAAQGTEDSQSCLVRPDDGPDDNAKGNVRIRSKNNSERFDVHVQKVEPGTEHHLWIEDPIDSDTFVDLGDLPKDGGSQKLALDTKKGDTLPLDVASVADLVGRRIEIRIGDVVELEGEVPPFGLDKQPKKAKETVDADDAMPQPDITGTIDLRSKENKGQERITLKLKKVDFDDGPFTVFVEDGVGSGVFVDEGGLDQTSAKAGRYRRDCKKGEALPGDVMFVSELSGRLLQVRGEGDVVFLEVTIPSL